jgi:NitT/TauT family transport system substrate-binding protein
MHRSRLVGMMLVAIILAGCRAGDGASTPTTGGGRAPAPDVASAPPAAQPTAPSVAPASAGQPPAQPAPALQPLPFGLNTAGAAVTPAWVAKDAGFFAKYGIDVELLPTGGGEKLVAAMLAGQIPLGALSGTGLVTAGLGGADLVFLGSFANRLRYWLYARPDNATVQDLRGKVLATSTRGGINRRGLELALRRHGLDPDRDVTLVASGGDSLVALLNGAVAATVLSPPAMFRAEDEGMRLLANITEYNYPTVLMGIAGSRTWVAQNEDLARRTLQAIAEAVVFTHREKERTKEIIARWTQNDDPVLLERTYNASVDGWERDLHVPAEGLRSELDDLAADLPAAREAKPEQFYDNHLVDELERSGFFQQLARQ